MNHSDHFLGSFKGALILRQLILPLERRTSSRIERAGISRNRLSGFRNLLRVPLCSYEITKDAAHTLEKVANVK